ncbi:uncharacterized protein LOC143463424 isoform X2 [Clavelina lepadiformis]|uniref:uncharacterized protein LOC143463424 isoform X2 n=1 Tax=Clavelina lepadiformis TaxID=159417 RepID=UPI004042A3EC
MGYSRVQYFIVLLAGVARTYGQSCGDVVNEDQDTDWIVYTVNVLFSPSTCEFTTSLSAEDGDVFMVTIYTNGRYDNGDRITLPAGGILPRSSQRWCGLYRKQEGDEINCGVDLDSLCPGGLTVSNDWPPVVRSESYSYTAFVEFQVIRCSDTMEETTTTTTSETTKTTRTVSLTTEDLTTAVSKMSTTRIGVSSTEFPSGVTSRAVSTKDTTTPLLVVIIVLSVLLVLSLLMLAIFTRKYLILRNLSPSAHDNDNNTRQATALNNQYENTPVNNNYEGDSNPYQLPVPNDEMRSTGIEDYDHLSQTNRNGRTATNSQLATNQLNQDTYAIAGDPNKVNELVDNVLYQPFGS